MVFRSRILVLFVFALLFGLALQVRAQDTSPLVTNTPAPALVTNAEVPLLVETAIPPENPRGFVTWESIAPYVISMFIIAILGVVSISGVSLVLLYRSIPPAAQSILTGGIDSLLTYLKTVAANSPPPWDDVIVEAGEEKWREIKQEASSPQTGQGLVEYALILVLVAVVVIVILALLGPTIGNIFSNLVMNLQCGGVPCPS